MYSIHNVFIYAPAQLQLSSSFSCLLPTHLLLLGPKEQPWLSLQSTPSRSDAQVPGLGQTSQPNRTVTQCHR